MNLLKLHQRAKQGDGLVEPFRLLLEHRRALDMDPRITELRHYNPAIPDVAGHPRFAQPIAAPQADAPPPAATSARGGK